MFLEDQCRAFVSAARYDIAKREQIVTEARRLLSTATPDDWESLSDALEDDQRKWFIAAIFAQSPLPKRLLKAMIRAAVYEVNPSLNRDFVTPCISAFGYRIVNEALLDVVETGNDFEKAGAVNALYQSGMPLSFPEKTIKFILDNATPESRGAYLELNDLWERKKCLFLREFVANENVDVRQSLIPFLKLDESVYPENLKPLVSKAIEIARHHSDEYIRHRVEVQLGNERLLYPKPHRVTPK